MQLLAFLPGCVLVMLVLGIEALPAGPKGTLNPKAPTTSPKVTNGSGRISSRPNASARRVNKGTRKAPSPRKVTAPKSKVGSAVGAPARKSKNQSVKVCGGDDVVVTHPTGREPTTLYHGVYDPKEAKSIIERVTLSMSAEAGDFHKTQPGCDGAFYLTDSIIAAAQFVCHEGRGAPAIATVLTFQWTPPPSLKLQSFRTANGRVINNSRNWYCLNYDLLVGPMNGPDDINLTKDFYQYAIVKQSIADKSLKYQEKHVFECKNIPKGKDAIAAKDYVRGQGRDKNDFLGYVKQLQLGPSESERRQC